MSGLGPTVAAERPAACRSQVETVIAQGYCIGCGACAAWPESPYRVELDVYGAYQAGAAAPVAPALAAVLDLICPFSDAADDEDTIADALFGDALPRHPRIGRYLATYAGHVEEAGFREQGSSGGLGSWLADQLLARGLADAVVQVAPTMPSVEGAQTAGKEALFRYRIARDRTELGAGAKSRYHPVTLAQVLAQVRAWPGRYVFVGLPCFIKAIRLTASQDPAFANSVACCIGLVCGHLKTRGYGECLGWQLGVPPAALEDIDFRKKLPGQGANRYGVEVSGRVNGRRHTQVAMARRLFGSDWGLGLFKPKACDYCDDVIAETADAVIGDAWLPGYVRDSRGSNILVLRRPDLLELVAAGRRDGVLALDEVTPEAIAASQASGLAHRREGLACRLWLADRQGQWRPRRRVEALAAAETSPLVRRQQLRIALRENSHRAFLEAKQQGDLAHFFDQIHPLAEAYHDVTRTPLRRLLARLRHLAGSRFRRRRG